MKGRTIFKGTVEAEALVSSEPISFYGGVDPDTGNIVEKGHPLEGKCMAGKVLVFPQGKGSTVGSYIIYSLKKNGKAPAAMICQETETIVAVGAIISEIPMIDKIDISLIKDGDNVKVDDDTVEVEE